MKKDEIIGSYEEEDLENWLPVRSVGRSARVTIGRTVRCVEEERMKFDKFKEKVKKEMQEYFQDQCEIHASLSAPPVCQVHDKK